MSSVLPSVSVCILNHDYARFLASAVESALEQDHPQVEVVVVDDGSTDDSLDVLAQYQGRIRLVGKQNGGQASAANAAFVASSGDVVIFLDADDMLEPHAARVLASAIAEQPGVARVQARMRIADADGACTGRLVPSRPGLLPSGDLRMLVLRSRNYAWTPTSANAFPRWVLERVLPIPEAAYRGDVDCYLAETTPLLGPVRSLAEITTRYRLHGANDFLGTELTTDWLAHKVDLVVEGDAQIRRLGSAAGLPIDEIPALEELPDVSFLGVRLALLMLAGGGGAFPDDRRGRLAVRGIVAALRHPFLPWQSRVERVTWFALTGFAPAPLARRVARSMPDGPGTSLRTRLFRRR